METFTDDTVVALASFLSPHDMLSLSLTCKRFGSKHGMNTKRSMDEEETGEELSISLMEVAAHAVLQTKWTDEEKKALPRRGDESWIGLYQEFLSIFRLPLQFDKLVGECVDYEDMNKAAVVFANSLSGSSYIDPIIYGTAICQNIMRSGKHCVSFQANCRTRSYEVEIGIMRPTTNDITVVLNCGPVWKDLSRFSLKGYEMLYGDNNVDCCLLGTYTGYGLIRERWKQWRDSELAAMDGEQRAEAELQNRCQRFNWEGQESIQETSFKIGMVLDLDKGTLDVYKNDRRLGTMMSGLVGEYCWVVSFGATSKAEASVSIGR